MQLVKNTNSGKKGTKENLCEMLLMKNTNSGKKGRKKIYEKCSW